MVDDEHRGYLLELLATKLLALEQQIQLVGMSATLSVSTRKCIINMNESFYTRHIFDLFNLLSDLRLPCR